MASAVNPLFWGKDAIFRSHAKLYIGDVMAMPTAEGFDAVFLYNSHPISKVDIMGVVVHADIKCKYSSYVLDDGTGTIFCTYWPTDNKEETLVNIPAGIRQLSVKVKDNEEGYTIGTVLHVRGKLRRYQSSTEINVSSLRKVTDPCEEVYRMMELPVLYTQCYDKSPETTVTTPQLGTANLQHAFQRFLVDHMRKESIKVIKEPELVSLLDSFCEQNSELAKENGRPDVKQAMNNLLETGVLYRSHESYVFVPQAKELEKEIMAILRGTSSLSDDGVQNRRLLQELKQRAEYGQLSLQALNAALLDMESNSDIISVSENYYIAFG